jgi:hypothetical protein
MIVPRFSGHGSNYVALKKQINGKRKHLGHACGRLQEGENA